MTRPEEGSAQEMVAPVSSMPMGEFASQRREFREQAHRLMVNKCRPHFYMHFRQKAWEVEPSRRTANLAYWSQRVEWAKSLTGKVCYPAVARRQFSRLPSWLVAAFDRIHTCEGSWTDPNAPYYGGLQMGWSFMRGFGSKALAYYGGPANLWPRYVQIVVASRYYYAYGNFNAWPTCKREV